ncbi:MAG: hypothetical protein LGB07_05090 [Sulfurovum sp.]|nr:hypothetical protein [Sulfurovum sp.]MCB4745007.1 hypothetical protein [Sulfurovum sp.]MCB4746138.1 hypothetical protein [Sulfurovum sp.]MCB4748178.1 hypothetical protein [Sulfurovum sp.]MCB4749574.1 hypothetical protein [Sulfurovum sp.]
METIGIIALGLFMLLGVTLSVLADENRKLIKENILLRESVGSSKNTKKIDIEYSHNASETKHIIKLIEDGNSIEDIAQLLNFPLDKVEMIIKFNRIKKEHAIS